MTNFNYDKEYSKIETLEKGEYENCSFNALNLSNANLSGYIFVDCIFKECNLSSAIMKGTAFRTVSFESCKMLGIQFEAANDFGFSLSFKDCLLGHTSFYQKKMKKTIFKNCQLNEVDFTEADLSESDFLNCNLQNATFNNSILLKTDFRTAINYTIDPELNKLKKSKFSIPEIIGLLGKYDIIIEK
ncbi:MAG: pentapeptide repeat-containing protein [Bacteroidia bacterium]|nr:pentapeptide repeat-containing protein [Bacteroidia bacterium]